ncbi:B12-binding domain-containing protein [candidate division CSSED10-310 bacterium]|uniref:B12-binding domain-containing protein n=1 Tax=candidate division CSSED10-310 bacterium TaxID=2855610 RepID=A0ABV6YQW9_UNCC1
MNIFEKIADGVEKGDAPTVGTLTEQALAEDITAVDILNQGLVKGMNVISELFKNNEIFIPEVLLAARAMKAGMAHIKPILVESDVQPKGKIVIGTVKGDLHDIGKNIVAMLLEGAGYQIIDLGADVPNEKFIEATLENQADIIGMSTLLTTTMVHIKDIIQTVRADNFQAKVKVIIGGASVSQSFADSIQADGYAPDASTVVSMVDKLLTE